MLSIVVYFLAISLICPAAWGHLCLIFPPQRGPMDITRGGSKTCARHEPECGGQPPDTPMSTYMGGKQMWIKWQQNYNHYVVGYPGYMDISIVPISSPTWQTIAYVPDEYFYAQDHQQNYTAIVILPNIDCEHCVVRARYQSHKPGESIFYQCADIAITKTSPQSTIYPMQAPLPPQEFDPQYRAVMKKYEMLRAKYDMKAGVIDSHCLIGFSYNPIDQGDGFLMSVNVVTGSTNILEEFYIIIALREQQKHQQVKQSGDEHGNFVYDAISAINSNGNLINLYHEGATADVVDDFVMEVDLKHPGDIIKRAKIVNGPGYPISAIMPIIDDRYYTIILVDRAKDGHFVFFLGQISYTATQQFSYEPVMWSEPEPLYVNYQWAEYDSVRYRVYLLMGNENSPDRLQARIYTYDIAKRNVTWVELDVGDYTFMSMHIHKKSGRLFAVSPGTTYHFNPIWSLIEIDPTTGKSKLVSRIADAGYFALYYGGTIFQGIDEETDTLYHVFRLLDTTADVIVGINLNNYKMTISGITNLRQIHNLSYIRANNTCYN